jgi:hypothetical protein
VGCGGQVQGARCKSASTVDGHHTPSVLINDNDMILSETLCGLM